MWMLTASVWKQSFQDKCVPKLELGNEERLGTVSLGPRAARPVNLQSVNRLYICAITLSPNSEHLISVAPSIKRAKS